MRFLRDYQLFAFFFCFRRCWKLSLKHNCGAADGTKIPLVCCIANRNSLAKRQMQVVPCKRRALFLALLLCWMQQSAAFASLYTQSMSTGNDAIRRNDLQLE
jgi:hypothetical protein